MATATPNLSEVVIKLPLNFFQKKEIGFTFNTLAYAFMCDMFEPKIDFHQIEEVSKLKSDEALVKLITGGALSYCHAHKIKCIVNENLVLKWLTKMPAKERDSFMDKINVAILNGKIAGKQVSEIIDKNVKKK